MYWDHDFPYKKLMRRVPVSAKIVVFSRNNKVLLLRKAKGLYDLPGGKVERGEDVIEALHRELLEETGLRAKNFRFVSSWLKTHPRLGDRLMLAFMLRLKKKSKDLSVSLSDEHRWGRFVSVKDAMSRKIGPGYKSAIHLAADHLL